MTGRIVRPRDFERVLAMSPCARSAHFSLHHLAQVPSVPHAAQRHAHRAEPDMQDSSTQLSTGLPPARVAAVEDTQAPDCCSGLTAGAAQARPTGHDGAGAAETVAGPDRCWLGLVVPKRHARRAVTRSLIKRLMRVAVADAQDRLPHGLWVLRLKAPFDVRQFPSAQSDALRLALRAELRKLIGRAPLRAAAAAAPVSP